MKRRWILLAALALIVGWRAWPADSADETEPAAARQPRSGPSPVRVRNRATPPAPGVMKTGIAACDRFVERSIACAQLPHDARIAIAEASKAWARVTSADSTALEASCRATASVHADALAAMGC